ncbi:hypothetical protein BD309DRAFT_956179 [Dichomitus squalens]|nr:hypothetical protein BD309DRAFT_956179 [Dichomitus squalens]
MREAAVHFCPMISCEATRGLYVAHFGHLLFAIVLPLGQIRSVLRSAARCGVFNTASPILAFRYPASR